MSADTPPNTNTNTVNANGVTVNVFFQPRNVHLGSSSSGESVVSTPKVIMTFSQVCNELERLKSYDLDPKEFTAISNAMLKTYTKLNKIAASMCELDVQRRELEFDLRKRKHELETRHMAKKLKREIETNQ